jgi:ATP-dependent Clp protease ATP-binding subunit ClpB
MRMEIEETALKNEKDKASKDRLGDLRKELADLKGQSDAMRARWQAEKTALAGVQGLRAQIEKARLEGENAERKYDLERLAQLRHGVIPDLERKLAQQEKALKGKEKSLLREEVTEEEIGKVVSRWSGVPVSRLLEGEKEKLSKLDEILHKRVIGQDEAVQHVVDAVMRARAGIKDPRRPIGSFIFLGPTGVGKTELAKTLAAALFDNEENMTRLDMSEYMEKHTVSRLVGAPPGYVGYDEAGQLTEAVRRKPYSVILLDEIEKAHPDVFNILLQILDDGRLTDSHGRTVNFKNTIVIMTSNIGSPYLLERIDGSGTIPDDVREKILAEMRTCFRPEFLNRVDDVVLFKPLTQKEMSAIVDLQVEELKKRLAERGIRLDLTGTARDFIAMQGYDPVYGARPLKRFIQQQLETPLARKLVTGDIADGATVKARAKDGKLEIGS